jgi:hypothetical protein
MTPEVKRTPPWVKDALVFVWMAGLNFVLIVSCGAATALVTWTGPGSGGPFDVWFWVFATPPMVAETLGQHELAKLLVLLNPPIYGLQWWLLWRVVKAWRTRTAD